MLPNCEAHPPDPLVGAVWRPPTLRRGTRLVLSSEGVLGRVERFLAAFAAAFKIGRAVQEACAFAALLQLRKPTALGP